MASAPPSTLSSHVMLLLFSAAALIPLASNQELSPPTLTSLPPSHVSFSNSTGTRLECLAKGHPPPKVTWLSSDGSPLLPIASLRQIQNGVLILPPFEARHFRQDVHANAYKCAAQNDAGTTVSYDVIVKAVVLQPYDIYVYDVFAITGNTAVFRCHVPNFLMDHVTVIAWIRDSVVTIGPEDSIGDAKYYLTPTGELYVKDVNPQDVKATFQCQIKNQLTGETKTSTTAGKLFVTDSHTNVLPKITFSRKLASVKGENAAFLPCEAQGNPTPQIKWERKTPFGIRAVMPSERHSIISGSLIINEAEVADVGTYECIAINRAGTDRTATELVFTESLRPTVQPPLAIIDGGKSIKFTCNIEGSPVSKIEWLKDGKPITGNNVQTTSADNHTLLIETVSSAHVGIYQCFVSNDFESAFGQTWLKLGDVPPSILNTLEDQIVHPGPSVVLECVISGNPVPTISWYLENTEITMNNRITHTQSVDTKGNTVSKLTIRQITVEDGGLYRCLASNKAGKSYSQARVNVYGKLAMRTGMKVLAVAGKQTTLSCPVYGYPYGKFTWEYREMELPADIRQDVQANGSLVIKNANHGADSGLYKCVAQDDKGRKVFGEVRLNVMVPPKIAPFAFQEELVREGMRGRLQCVVLEGDAPLTLIWLKDNQPVTLTEGITVRHIDEFSSILTISSINPRHNGNYTCEATNSAAKVSFTSRLAVNVSPKIIPFSFPSSGVMEGNLAMVSCGIYQGDLPITFNWLKDGKVSTDISGVVVRRIDDYSTILTIDQTEIRHAGNYTCVASNSADTSRHSSSLTVQVPPKIVPFSFPDEPLLEGMLVRVSCVVSRGDLPLAITWYKDGSPIPASLPSVSIRDFDEYSSILSIDPVSTIHSGSYKCVAKNHASTDSHMSHLQIHVPPKWLEKPENKEVGSGETVFLHCRADGLPKPTVAWSRLTDDRKIIPIAGMESFYVFPNGTLRMLRISKEKEGKYFCTISNGVGLPLSLGISVKVLAPPHFSLKSETVNGKRGANLTLTCSANGDIPLNFEWTIDGQRINPAMNRRSQVTFSDISQSELTIMWLDRKDSNSVACKAINSYGSDEKLFMVKVQEPPETIEIPSVFGGNRSASLSWNAPFDGHNAIVRYIVQYKKEIDNWQLRATNVSVNGNQTSTIVSGLYPATTYHFRIAAENAVGLGDFSNYATGRTDDDIPMGSPQNVEVESMDQHTLRITWKPPRKSLWNGPIQGYNVGFKVEGSLGDFEFSTLEVPEDYTEDLIYQLTDLKLFTLYSIIVRAYNSKGQGPASEPVVAMTSEDVPSAPPQGIRCSALSARSIYVLWEPPTSDTLHGILRGYKVLYKPVNEWYDTGIQVKVSQTTKVTLQELQVHTNYTFQILAFTKAGDGVKSTPIFCKTHEDVPDAPASIKVLPASSDSVVVAWKSPKAANGAVTKYNVYYKSLAPGEEKPDTGDTASALMSEQVVQEPNAHVARAEAQYMEVKGLKKNQKYAFWVTASSVIGEGQSSDVMAQTVAEATVSAKSASFDDEIKTPWKRDVVLPCRAVGVPPPQRKWKLGTKSLELNERRVILSDGTLILNKVSSEDTGNYTCLIYNENGKDKVKYTVFVHVPPAAPLVDVISKAKTSFQLQWKPGPNGGDNVRGYVLHYRRDQEQWETKELRPDQELFTLDGLACGTNYQLYLEAFNNIGTGAPCDVITVATEGGDTPAPSKDSLITEGSTFATIYLESWPSKGCSVDHFQVEYKPFQSSDWIEVSNSIRATQRKLVIPGLSSATWYTLRLTAVANGISNTVDYQFATHTANGGTIPPPEIRIEKRPEPVYVFYLDPSIFIPAVALLIVVIIASVVVCVWAKRKNGSEGSPSGSESTINTCKRRPASYGASGHHQTLNRRGEKDGPYATAQLPGCFAGPNNEFFVANPELVAFDPRWAGDHMGTLTIQRNHHGKPRCHQDGLQQASNNVVQETTFVFPGSNPQGCPLNQGTQGFYDQPPTGM